MVNASLCGNVLDSQFSESRVTVDADALLCGNGREIQSSDDEVRDEVAAAQPQNCA